MLFIYGDSSLLAEQFLLSALIAYVREYLSSWNINKKVFYLNSKVKEKPEFKSVK